MPCMDMNVTVCKVSEADIESLYFLVDTKVDVSLSLPFLLPLLGVRFVHPWRFSFGCSVVD